MKHFLYLIAILAFTLISCSPVNTNKGVEKDDQARFSDFLEGCHESESRALNDIQRAEYMDTFEHQLANHVDSVIIFNNWKCQISNIKSTDYSKSVNLTFDLEVEPRQYQKISFDVSYILPKDSIAVDSVYQFVKNTRNYSTVYVDGFIPINRDNTVKYDYGDMHLNYPNYKFYVTQISDQPVIVSDNLRTALSLMNKQLKLLRGNYWKQISDIDKTHKVDSIMPIFEEAQSKLTPSEKKYLSIYGTQFANDFLYNE